MNYHDISTPIVSFVSYKPSWPGAAPTKGPSLQVFPDMDVQHSDPAQLNLAVTLRL